MKNNNLQEIQLGDFEVTSGKLAVSDPCYSMDTWCKGILENVKNGTWKASVLRGEYREWGVRNHVLTIVHKDYHEVEPHADHTLNADIGVDSGQAGFFDLPVFENKNNAPADTKLPDWIGNKPNSEGRWYSMCCNATYDEDNNEHPGAGIIPGGVVTSSGVGDGSYTCQYYTNGFGEVIKAIIDFHLCDEEDED